MLTLDFFSSKGKTAFATSLPGFYNFMGGPWVVEAFNPYAAYTIYHYVPWDDFRLNGYPDKELLFSQSGRIHVRIAIMHASVTCLARLGCFVHPPANIFVICAQTINTAGNPATVDVLQPAVIILAAHQQGSLANIPSTSDVVDGGVQPHFWNHHAYIYRMSKISCIEDSLLCIQRDTHLLSLTSLSPLENNETFGRQ